MSSNKNGAAQTKKKRKREEEPSASSSESDKEDESKDDNKWKFPLTAGDRILFTYWNHVLEGTVTQIGENAHIQVTRTSLPNVAYPWKKGSISTQSLSSVNVSDDIVGLKLDVVADNVVSVCRMLSPLTQTVYASRLVGFRDFWLNKGDKIQLIQQGSKTHSSYEEQECGKTCPCRQPSKNKGRGACTNCPFDFMMARVVAETETEVRIVYIDDDNKTIGEEYIPRNSLRCWRRISKHSRPKTENNWIFHPPMDHPLPSNVALFSPSSSSSSSTKTVENNTDSFKSETDDTDD